MNVKPWKIFLDSMKLSYIASSLKKLNSEERHKYWETLAHNLTVSCRGIWSDAEFSDSEKIVGMKVINEILHRVIVRISVERKDSHKRSDEEIFQTIALWASQSPKTKGHVAWALIASLSENTDKARAEV